MRIIISGLLHVIAALILIVHGIFVTPPLRNGLVIITAVVVFIQ